MRVLCLPMVEGRGFGTAAELLAIAESLALRGHQIRFLIGEHHAVRIRDIFDCTVVSRPIGNPGAKDFPPDCTLGDAALIYGFASSNYLFQAVRAELSEIDNFRPHVIVSSVKVTSVISSRLRNLPIASIAASTEAPGFKSSLFPNHITPAISYAGANEVLSFYGLPMVGDLAELSFARSDLGIAPTAPMLDPSVSNWPHVEFSGPLLPMSVHLTPLPADSSKARGESNILVYLNRGSHSAEYERALAIELDREFSRGYHVLILDSPVNIAATENRLTVRSSIPLTVTMPRTTLLISAGGRGAMQSALLHGVPIVALPGMHAERYFNATAVAQQGACELICGQDPSPKHVVQVAKHVLSTHKYYDAASMVGTALREFMGAVKAATLIEALGQ